LPPVALYFSVPEPYDAAGVSGDILLMRYEENGVACRGEFAEDLHDLMAGRGIEVSCGLIGQNN